MSGTPSATPAAIPTQIPHGRTARRLEWTHLPPAVRREVERRIGTPVTAAASQRGGFTPGFASVLTGADGTRHFVKAASAKAQRTFALAYREEARKARLLPPGVAAPRLKWVHDADDWVVLGFEYVPGRAPQRPWVREELDAASAMLVETARALTPAPGLGLKTFAEEFADLPALWDKINADYPSVPGGAEAAELAAGFAEVTAGDTLVHTDVRDDNLIVRADGSVVLCDWNWPVRGAAWIDSLALLIGPRGDGIDVEAVIAEHPLLSAVDPEAIDRVLAVFLAHFWHSADLPVPPTSPHLRAAQLWQGEVVHAWLSQRRGWE